MLLKSVIILLCAICVLSQESDLKVDPQPSPQPPIDPTTKPPTPPTTKPTSSPITKPTTPPTTKPTTPPTTKPTTPPTTKPTTPTTKPTTPPTTKPTVPPTPTPKPDNKLAINDYNGTYTGQKFYCLRATMAVQVEILEKDKKSTFINVPKAVNATVDCPVNSSVQSLTIIWANKSVKFGFFKNGSRYEIQSINTTMPGENNTMTYYHMKPELSVSVNHSYYCSKDQPLNLTDANNNTVAKIHLSSLQYQAFMNDETAPNYGSVWNCDGANMSDVVPIVIGCVLAILVITVLAVYLYGRRRCQARGYLSM